MRWTKYPLLSKGSWLVVNHFRLSFRLHRLCLCWSDPGEIPFASPKRSPSLWRSVSPVRGHLQEEPVVNTKVPYSSSLKVRVWHRHGRQYGDSQRERGVGEWKWARGGQMGNGNRLDFGWSAHDAGCRWCFIELYTWNLYVFINQYPSQ